METIFTGEQNSSKAGFTNVMYWVRTASRSRPRSLISLGTVKKMPKLLQTVKNFYNHIKFINLDVPNVYQSLYPQIISYEIARES